MKLNVVGLALIMTILGNSFVFAQQITDAEDLMINIASAVDLNFQQEDLMKPIIKKYVKTVQQVYDDAQGNDRVVQSQISLLNYGLQQKVVPILSTKQIKKWDEAKKSLLPQKGE
jgi:hypothetical protein